MTFQRPQPGKQSRARSGATLTEVLMAVMLSGIGVVTLAVLFPISILRSIQATQLTNATILRYNAESLIDLDRSIVFNPDADDPTIPANIAEHFGEDSLFDPLGLNNSLGGSVGALTRYQANYNSVTSAAQLVTLPDSYIFVVEEPGVTYNAGPPATITFPTADLANIPNSLSRVICFNTNGRSSEVRGISAIAGNVVTLQTPLPTGYSIEKARIETVEQRYTWLLTIRRQGGGSANIDVVVFFRRSFDPSEDNPYSLDSALGPPGPNDGFAFTTGSDTVEVNYASNNKPFYKKGSYVLDAQNGYWYQIEQVDESVSGKLKITIDRPAIERSDQAVFMRGIVDVYPLGTKT